MISLNERRKRNSDAKVSPSRIPVKSPAKPAPNEVVGGLAVAYSPRANENEPQTNTIDVANDDYSRKLQNLRSAMELLKTPPKKSTSNATQETPQMNRSWSTEVVTESSALKHNSFTISSSSPSLSVSSDLENDEMEIKSILSRLDSAEQSTQYKSTEFSSPVFSSPVLSAEELKARLEATKAAFQRSLAQQQQQQQQSTPLFQSSPPSFADLKSTSRSQLRGVPVSFDDLEAEIDKQFGVLASEDESLRRTSQEVNQIHQELLELSKPRAGNSVVVLVSVLMAAVGVVLGVLAVGVHWSSLSEHLNWETFLVHAEALLNYLLQD